jgi:predicted metal-dependent HD superfamily phosphohydrolase
MILKTRWNALWKELGVDARSRDIIFEDLTGRYAEPWRAYHALSHIESMLIDFDAFRTSPEARFVDIPVVEMVIWYHDAVYHPPAHDSESQSAKLFCLVGRLIFLREQFMVRVVEGILATRHHAPSDNPTTQTICDLDLAILGKPEKEFDLYEKQIRTEYDAVLELIFRRERARILEGFAERHIYSTNFFNERYEDQAHKNLDRSIARLSS